MREAEDETTDFHEGQPLISDAEDDHNQQSRHSDEDNVDESVIESPGLFIWALTFSAGVSGLLFGYEYVLTHLSSPRARSRIRRGSNVLF